MKRPKFVISAALLLATAFTANVLCADIDAESTYCNAPEARTVVVTLLGGAQRTERGDLAMSLNANGGVDGLIFRDIADRSSTFRLIDREHPSEVACNSKDGEYGSLTRKDGSWIGVAVCPKGPHTAAIAIPSLLRSRMSANEASASADMKCWENKELLMGVCYKAGSNPSSAPMPQTREHILLARQVG